MAGFAVKRGSEEGGSLYMPHRSMRLPLIAAVPALVALVISAVPALADNSPDPIDDDSLQPSTANFGGADPLGTDRTVQHWSGEATNPLDGITYRYSMVGVAPSSDDAATIGVDIIPIDVQVDGLTFSGAASVAGVLASPLFNNFDYSRTLIATKRDPMTGVCCVARVQRDASGRLIPFALSNGNAGQLIDATMRSMFDKIGSGYHLYLDPNVLDTVMVKVPDNHGTVGVNPVGVRFGQVDDNWFQARVQNLIGKYHLDSTRLAVFLTTDVVLYKDNDPTHCCQIGGHGAGHVTGAGTGDVNANGNQPVQTFVWASWMTPGVFGPRAWITKDINALSHEITSWAADPFNNNAVQPWLAANAPQYGCSSLLETADPTVNVGFAVGMPGANHYNRNPFAPSANPFDDGTFHVEDQVFIPWFMRMGADNTFSQPTQSGTGGRYTFMGDLNPLAEFHQPARSC
jgi:hypothetical protein